MKMTKMALLAGAALAVTTAGAQADDLEALKAQIETLNARVAAMETAPSVPAGYQLIAVSKGELQQTPGLHMSARERALFGNRSTVISVLPTADAPAGATISWSGYARAGLVYENESVDQELIDDGDVLSTSDFADLNADTEEDDIDVEARGEIRVKASTDTAVGEVGVDIRLRGDFNGNGTADIYSDVAWGYWAMTPELTFGGGYTGSLGNIDYGYDGACYCEYTDNADLDFNPGDVTQMRLSYASGPFSMAIALEDGSIRKDELDDTDGDRLGAAGEIKFSGDSFSGEISGVWRDVDENAITTVAPPEAQWQVGMGVGFALGDVATLSLAAAMGEGRLEVEREGEVIDLVDYNNSWWGVTALASMNLSDEVHAELAVGYKNREGDSYTIDDGALDGFDSSGVEYETYGVMGGVYYTPVDQLTIGLEGEWYTTSIDEDLTDGSDDVIYKSDTDTFSANLVSLWRF